MSILPPHAPSSGQPVCDPASDHDNHAHHQGQRQNYDHDMPPAPGQRLTLAIVLTSAFMVAEVVGGLWTGSLALLADAGHMFADSAAMLLAWVGYRLAVRPPDTARTYGYRRLEVLIAFANGVTLVMLVAGLVIEALRRLHQPPEVLSGPMLVIAGLGLLVNLGVLAVLWQSAHGAAHHHHHGHHHGHASAGGMGMRAVVAHVLGDVLGSLAAIVAALVIARTGWMLIDPLLSLLAAALILRNAVAVIRESGHVLLEGTPTGLDLGHLRAELRHAVPEIADIHHLHAWSLTSEHPLLSLHVVLRATDHHEIVLQAVKSVLLHRYGIQHSVIQIETETSACPDGACGPVCAD